MLAMRDAVRDLAVFPDYLLVDGLYCVPLDLPQRPLVKGDGLSLSIAAASIIAKVSRDRIMEMYHRQFPQYNFITNKGYPTAEHRDIVARIGMCKIHRRSFHVRKSADDQTCLEWPE